MQELDIAEVASLAGVTPSALRFYEKKGLLRPIGRNGLRRQYGEDVLNRLALIALGQSAGFTLEAIAGLFDEQGRITLKRQCLLSRAEEVDKTILQLEKVSAGLKHVANCSAADRMQCPNFLAMLQKALPVNAPVITKKK